MAGDSPRWHALTVDQVASELRTGDRGLTADTARERLAEHGRNELQQAKRRAWVTILVSQFRSPLIAILLAAGVVALAVG